MTQRVTLSGRYVGHLDETIEIECVEVRFKGVSEISTIVGARGDTMRSVEPATLSLIGLSVGNAHRASDRKWTHVTWGDADNSRTGTIKGRASAQREIRLSLVDVR